MGSGLTTVCGREEGRRREGGGRVSEIETAREEVCLRFRTQSQIQWLQKVAIYQLLWESFIAITTAVTGLVIILSTFCANKGFLVFTC